MALSLQTILEKIITLTETINGIKTNAKKIDELPAQTTLDPASKIHVSRGGKSEKLPIQTIINAIQERTFNRLISIGELTWVGNVVSIPAGASWLIEDLIYVTIEDINITVEPTAAGMERTDFLVGDKFNQIVLVKGPENDGVFAPPNIPFNTVYITQFGVNDAGLDINTIIIPIIGIDYVEKAEDAALIALQSGVVAFIPINTIQNRLILKAATELKSISHNSSQYIRDGKDLYLQNDNTVDCLIPHLFMDPGFGGYSFSFPTEAGYLLTPKEIAHFKLKMTGSGVGVYEYVGQIFEFPIINIVDVVGLQGALDAKAATTYVDAADQLLQTNINAKAATTYVDAADAVLQANIDQKASTIYVDAADAILQAGINTKAATTYVDGLVDQLIGGAPVDANTLNELNDKILAIQAIIGGPDADADAVVNTVKELLAIMNTFPEGVNLNTLLGEKVNVTDIYNGLDGIVAGKVLDARQGKILLDFIAQLEVAMELKEDLVNKKTDVEANKTSNVFYPTIKAMVDWINAEGFIKSVITSLGYTPERENYKSQSIETDQASTTQFPSVKAVFDWAVGRFQPKLTQGANITIDNTNPLAPVIAATVPTLKTLNNATLIGTGNISIPLKLKEVVVQDKTQLFGVLDSTKLYLIDGSFSLLAGETIQVPAGGLNIMGYSFYASRISSYGIANHKIFTSPVGGSGNLILHNIAFTTTGTGAGVFDIIDSDGTHAVEMVTVNFEGCKQIGKIRNYRQGTGITIGMYGCADGLQLSGTWTGFKMTNTNCFSFGATGTVFKKDTDTIFSNRLYLEVNMDLPTGAKLADFQASNFSLNELFQINSSILKLNAVINDDNAATVIPNIKANDVKCLWRSNVGLPDTATEKYIESATVTGSYVINWLRNTYYLTMTGNTTFTETNLPATGKNTDEIKIYLNGNFTPTFPAAWNVNRVGTWKTNEMNQLTLKFIKTGVYFLKIDNSLSVYPAPNVSSVAPSKLMPGTTSQLTVYGSFFTPATIVSIASHTVNSVTFVNQGELVLSVTTSAAEGNFDLTISNGTTVVYNFMVTVMLGTVYLPQANEWTIVTGQPKVDVPGVVEITTFNSLITLRWNKPLEITRNFSVRMSFKRSPLGIPNESYGIMQFSLVRNSDKVRMFRLASNFDNNIGIIIANTSLAMTGNDWYTLGNSSGLAAGPIDAFLDPREIEFRYVNSVMYLYLNGTLKRTYTDILTENMLLEINVKSLNIKGIKYIELT